jgi:pimeloyl-ACP methyl ester carboxylesterase
VTAAGTAPSAVVFLPGLGQLPTDWQAQITAVPAGWRAFVPWLAGMKPTDPARFDLDRAVGGVVSLLEAESLPRAHVCGLSLGAVVAVRLAAQHPELVGRLVLASGQVSPPRSLLKLQLAMTRRTPESRFRKEGLTRERAVAALEALSALDLRADLARVQAPTLVLTGSGDRANRSAAKALAAGIRGARLEVLDGGHALNTQSPEAFNRAVFGFLVTEG